jgi:NAD(P)H-dependent FMN reductase
MRTVIGIPGSLRAGSYNRALLRAAAEAAPDDMQLQIADIGDIPLYDGDVEAAGIPSAVSALKDTIAAADGIILATPEYNNSVPGVLKNALDWVSRPPADQARVLRDKPIALAGASMGGFGTVLAQNAWLPIIRALGMRPWTGGRLLVSRAQDLFDENGRLRDGETREGLERFLTGFGQFISR